ncbi:hypothetical protein ALI144C_14045 [Actinosynnema sp. ALI-1.44]|nr:hypothetical protein ALI144C_14045 [Actinosynnema sp. ALI-1.44]
MSLWRAAYLWAQVVSDVGGRSRHVSETVRAVITYAITVEARHVPDLVPQSCRVDGLVTDDMADVPLALLSSRRSTP